MKYLLWLLLTGFIAACSNNANQSGVPDTTIAPDGKAWHEAELTPEQMASSKEHYYVWDVDANKKMIKINPMLQPQYFNVDTLIAGLNEKFPEILLAKRGLSNDTLYTEIKNASYLTERMGSLGAEQYIAYVVLNITSVEGVNFLRIDFEEGSHAAPDVWSRESFKNYKEETEQVAD